jgi:AcrR family transcriptional regulator
VRAAGKEGAGHTARRASESTAGAPRGSGTGARRTPTRRGRRTGPRDAGTDPGLPRGPQALPQEQVAEHQRQRLYRAMVECVDEHGYVQTTISELVARARVSRRSFYERFPDKDACLVGAYDTIVKRLLRRLRDGQMSAGPEWSAQLEAFLRTLFKAAGDRPDAARLVCVEMAAAGPIGVRRWAEGAQLLQEYLIGGFAGSPGPGTLPEPVARAIVGAVRRILYTRVRGARSGPALQAELASLIPDLLGWIACYYPTPAGLPLRPAPLRGKRREAARIGGRAPGTLAPPPASAGARGLPRGEHHLPRGYVLYNQRERIFDAIANLTAAKGYPALSLCDIAAAAAVSLQTFYRHFDSKEDAFIATYEAGHAHAMALLHRTLMGHSCFSAGVRAGAEALLEMLACEPSYAHVACVDVMTAYPHMPRRAREANGFYGGLIDASVAPDSPPQLPSPVVGEAMVGGVFELLHDYVLHDRTDRLPELTDHVAYIVLAPCMGAKEAWRAIVDAR